MCDITVQTDHLLKWETPLQTKGGANGSPQVARCRCADLNDTVLQVGETDLTPQGRPLFSECHRDISSSSNMCFDRPFDPRNFQK